jgi:hypothetical protein
MTENVYSVPSVQMMMCERVVLKFGIKIFPIFDQNGYKTDNSTKFRKNK